MRTVFNYRKAFREPKKVRQIAKNVNLPFAIDLVTAANYIIFFAITFVVGLVVRKYYPYSFQNTWIMLLFGIPALLTTLVKKIKPEGKNIYIYIYDFIKYLFQIKLPKKQIINGRDVEFKHDRKIRFKKCVRVVDSKDGKFETSGQSNQRQFIVNERGRRIRVLPYQEQVDSDSEQKSSRAL